MEETCNPRENLKDVPEGFTDVRRQNRINREQSQPQCCEAMRENARSMLKNMVRSIDEKARNLEALSDALPQVLPPKADQALFDLLLAARRL